MIIQERKISVQSGCELPPLEAGACKNLSRLALFNHAVTNGSHPRVQLLRSVRPVIAKPSLQRCNCCVLRLHFHLVIQSHVRHPRLLFR